jgi:hypothetical protein
MERSGIYTVRSAYRLLHKRKSENLLLNQPSSSDDGPWRKVWKLGVPPKVRVFWWRVLNDFLPTRQELCRRHVEPISICEVCGDPEESIKHVLLDCTVAKLFWEQTREATNVKIPALNAATWAVDLMSDLCPKRDQAVIMCGTWAVWMMRNKRRHELSMSVHQAVTWARDTAFDLWQLSHQRGQRDTDRAVQRWKKPPPGCLKINTDAAFSDESKQDATSCIIRDRRGAFYAAQANWYERGYDACSMEAVACRDSLILAGQLECTTW